MGAEPVRVLVVEASPLMRRAVAQRLNASGAVVVGEAHTNVEALVEYAQRHPDVVTVDVRFGHESGFVLIDDVLHSDPNAVVLVYSGSDDPQLARQAVAAGAAGYVRKDASRAELEDCLRLALRGIRPVFDRRTATAVRTGTATDRLAGPAQLPHLTARQREVLQLMAAGTTSNKAIARELFISEKTVKSHIERIAASLDVSQRTQLALRALELGLIAMIEQAPARSAALPAKRVVIGSRQLLGSASGTGRAHSSAPGLVAKGQPSSKL